MVARITEGGGRGAAGSMGSKIKTKVGTTIVKATLGKKSAATYKTQSMSDAKKLAETKAAVKTAAKKKPLAEPKSAVKIKPAAKPVGNPPNFIRADSKRIESVVRGDGVNGPLGKRKDGRVFRSKKPTGNK